MDPITNQILQGIAPLAGAGSTLERNALIGVIRNLISEDKYNVDYILNYAQSVGYSRQMAEDVFKELTGLSPKLIVNNNEYYNMPAYVPNMCIAWGISKSNKEKAFYIVPFEYGYAVMEKDEVNAPIPTVISATIPEAFEELKKVAKNIQTLDKIITKKLLETEEVPTDANDVHQVNLPYSASPLQILKKNFKDKVLSVSEFERQASKLLASEEITVDEAEDLMAWKQDLIDEDESYANEVLENNEKWNQVQATVEFDDIYNELKEIAHHDDEYGFNKDKVRAIFEANKDMFQEVDLVEAVNRLYQLLLGFSKEEILGHSEFKGKSAAEIDDSNFDYTYITKEEWDNTPDDYKMLIDGIRYMMFPINHPENGGKLCPVKIKNASLKQSASEYDDAQHIINILRERGNASKETLDKLQKSLDTRKTLDKKQKTYQDNVKKQQEKDRQDFLEALIKYKSASKKVTDEDEFEKAFENDLIIDDENDNAWFPGYEEHKFKIEPSYEKMKEKALKIWKQIHSSKKITAENMTLDDIEAEDNKDQVQEEIEKIDETPAEDIFSETTPEQYFDKALQEDKVDTINDVVSKCIDKFSEKFKDFDKYQVKILSYNTKVLGEDKPIQEEMVQDKEIDANAILQVILQITNNAEEENVKKVLAVFSITNGELHWTGTVRGENDQVVAFTEEGLDALFEVDEPSEEELEDII